MNEIHILASRMMVQQKQLGMIADNVANSDTDGFKKMGLSFQGLVSRKGGETVGAYTQDRGTHIQFEGGGLKITNNPLDMAIKGEGFFAVRRGGQIHYTRNGHFTLSADGTIITEKGDFLLDTGNTPIVIPEGSKEIIVTREGGVATEDGVIAELGLYSFTKDDMANLKRTGSSSFMPTGDARPIATLNPAVTQGALEGSNVNGLLEVVTLQEMTRAYVGAQKMMKGIEDLENRAIRSLPRLQ